MEEIESSVTAVTLNRHIQTLHSWFREQPCFAWINPAQGDPFEGDELVEAHKIRVPISHPRFDLRYAPYLVALDLSRYQDSDVLARTVELAARAWNLDSLQKMNGQPVCGWIAASSTARELAGYWARACHVHYHNGLARLLRFQDPSVREWLWPALDSRQRATLLGPATQIFSIGRNGQLLEQKADETMPPTEATTLALTAKQWSDVEDYAIVHAAWLTLCAQDGTLRGRLSMLPDWQQQVLDCLVHATGYGVTDPQDRVLFARHALEIAPDFHFNAALGPVWERTRSGEFYGSALEEVTGGSADLLLNHLHRKV